ncbi:helix-turn-helix domain-containing protein [Sorangium sp. So ce375]|uniref:helix-turn-helix domain-containing protein n=1 Tax=Sorangium sp. So ce375 TaxID=3133306 RepID=UPI003F5BF5B6
MLAHDIGRAIEAARKRLGVSLEDLSASTSLDVAMLGSIERGEQLVSTAKLDRIASVLGIDAFALYNGREVERTLVVLPRYAAGSDFQDGDLPVLRRALERATALAKVSAIVGKTSLAGRFKPKPPGADPAQDGYHYARLVRRALGRTTEPLGSLPELLAEQFDVPVIVAPLATAALQAAAVRSSATHAAAVVLNPSVKDGPPVGSFQAWLVDRVSICHELCHIVFDEPRGGIVDIILDDLIRESQARPPIEQRAGAFAAEMLIPLFGLRKLLGQEGRQTDTPAQADRMVDEVRTHFKTPAEIAVNHLYNHGYIARISAFREDLIQRAQGRENPQSATPPAGEHDAWRQALIARTQDAHDRSLITDGAARALLELEPGEPLPWERGAL